jgi:ribonuclease R
MSQFIDPHQEREAAKYNKPIYSREYLLDYLYQKATPVGLLTMSQELELHTSQQKEALRRRIKAMLRDGQLIQVGKHCFWPAKGEQVLTGIVQFDKQKRLWFIPAEREHYIHKVLIPYCRNPAITHGAKVMAAVPILELGSSIVVHGKILELLEVGRQLPNIIGKFYSDAQGQYVLPHDKDQPHRVQIRENNSAQHGDIVVVHLVKPANRSVDPVGDIVQVIGNENHKLGVEVTTAILTYELPHQWEQTVIDEVQQLSQEVMVDSQRQDCRHLPFVTIDGEDSKDFDDAVFVEASPDGWHLYVAIADVSHYIPFNSALDQTAKERGTSVYFHNRVIPMLPETLSNNLCSLIPHTDRYALVCKLHLNNIGVVQQHQFFTAVICSQARLTYSKVANFLKNPGANTDIPVALKPKLLDLQAVYRLLHKKREERGAIDFDTISAKLMFNRQGKITHIVAEERNVAHKIIEECMLCANVAAAEFLQEHNMLGLYRVHEGPDLQKFFEVKLFLEHLGLSFADTATPQAYNALLHNIKHRADAHIVKNVLLRSMSQAMYTVHNVGHFGLAFPTYTHFTSPIRRYPDLLVHRQIKTVLSQHEEIIADTAWWDEIGMHCSITEKRADEATRYVDTWLKCQYMQQYIGKQFAGIISGVSRFGLFVELEKLYIDGLVHVNNLKNDYYVYDESKRQLSGERTKTIYTIGMTIQVRIIKVDVNTRKIDLELVRA